MTGLQAIAIETGPYSPKILTRHYWAIVVKLVEKKNNLVWIPDSGMRNYDVYKWEKLSKARTHARLLSQAYNLIVMNQIFISDILFPKISDQFSNTGITLYYPFFESDLKNLEGTDYVQTSGKTEKDSDL